MRRRTLGFRAKIHDRLDQLLALVVGRMRLAREDELDGLLRVLQQRPQAPRIAQQQRAALVRREATGEADRERLGIEHLVRRRHLIVAGAALDELVLERLPRPPDQPLATALVRPPQLFVGDLHDALPRRSDRSGRSAICR
jgi:hypothetical protein